MAYVHLHSRSLSDIAHSTGANNAQASALFSTPKNPHLRFFGACGRASASAFSAS